MTTAVLVRWPNVSYYNRPMNAQCTKHESKFKIRVVFCSNSSLVEQSFQFARATATSRPRDDGSLCIFRFALINHSYGNKYAYVSTMLAKIALFFHRSGTDKPMNRVDETSTDLDRIFFATSLRHNRNDALPHRYVHVKSRAIAPRVITQGYPVRFTSGFISRMPVVIALVYHPSRSS